MGELADDMLEEAMREVYRQAWLNAFHRGIDEAMLNDTPEPPADLTYEEQVGWRHGWLAAEAWSCEEDNYPNEDGV